MGVGTIKKNINKVMSQSDEFKLVLDDESGNIAIIGTKYGFTKSIVLSIDEMPDRYQAFFTKYLLSKDR